MTLEIIAVSAIFGACALMKIAHEFLLIRWALKDIAAALEKTP